MMDLRKRKANCRLMNNLWRSAGDWLFKQRFFSFGCVNRKFFFFPFHYSWLKRIPGTAVGLFRPLLLQLLKQYMQSKLPIPISHQFTGKRYACIHLTSRWIRSFRFPIHRQILIEVYVLNYHKWKCKFHPRIMREFQHENNFGALFLWLYLIENH